MNHVPDLNRTAADFAVFGIGLAPDGHVEHHRNSFAAIRTFEEAFHIVNVVLTYQRGSCTESRKWEESS
jgi:hypothetical protein